MLSKIQSHVEEHPLFYSILLGGLSGAAYFKYQQKLEQAKYQEMNQKNQYSKYQQYSISQDELQIKNNLKAQTDQIREVEPLIDSEGNRILTPVDKVFKICITGGPCAGKTSGLTYLSEKLSNSGFKVFVVPEAATMIAQGGGMLDMNTYDEDQKIAFQTALMKTQIQLEQCFMKIAKLGNKPSIVLCDRGLMDGSAYIDPEHWRKMLGQEYFIKNNLSEVGIRDRQYDAIVHLVTAADGAEEFYSTQNGIDVRQEPAKEAIKLDRKLQLAWLGHPRFEIIDNHKTSFEEKLQALHQTVRQICGLKGIKKLHKKFLIDTANQLFPTIPNDVKSQQFFIEDTFIAYEKQESNQHGQYIRVRRRGQGEQSIYIWSRSQMKGKKDNVTLKKMMTYKEYLAMLSKIDDQRHPIIKQRKQFMWEGSLYAIDTYLNVGEGFSTLKLTYDSEENMPKIPEFIKIIRDITEEEGYKTKYLAKKNWYSPSGDENIVNLRKESLDI